MADWREVNSFTRYPEDNDVIGVPFDADCIQMTQAEADLQSTLTMELRESEPYRFAEQTEQFAIIVLKAKIRKI